RRYPPTFIPRSDSENLWSGFHALRHDVLFRQTIVSWMFLGVGNLMMLPLRVEYLGNPRYQLNLSADEIVLLVLVIPTVARFLALPVFGWLFDRVDFFVMRLVANACFIAYTLAFFMTNSYAGLVAGAVILGLSHGGGEVAWSLWVTKVAPDGKVASYMAVHSFFTGVRGVFAPFLGFFLIERYDISSLAALHVALILTSMLVLAPHLGKDTKARDRRAELRRKRLAEAEAPESLEI
ncbi:MAG: MFS transporter, partial [Deltaproteobacteria bacterium]|nr:MFS transporter [Deltaproteobacteria bacterium]